MPRQKNKDLDGDSAIDIPSHHSVPHPHPLTLHLLQETEFLEDSDMYLCSEKPDFNSFLLFLLTCH